MASAIEWIEAPCDFCGSKEERLLLEGPDRLTGMPGQFRLVKCPQCGLIRQNPRLAWDGLKHYYPEDYTAYMSVTDSGRPPLQRWIADRGTSKRLRAIEKYRSGGKLLEVGCGTGLFIAGLLKTGRWEVVGLEPNRYAAEYAQEKTGVRVLIGRFTEVELPENTFDVITLWNVLEHVDDPMATLNYAHRLLKPRGVIVFSVPNVESLAARVFGEYWLGWDQPRHLFLFPAQTLRTMLDETGFEWLSTRCLSTSHAALGISIEFWSQSWPARFARWRQPLLRFYYSVLSRALLLGPLWILDHLKLTTIITYFARKR